MPLKGVTRFLENISSNWLQDKTNENYENKNLLYDGTVYGAVSWM